MIIKLESELAKLNDINKFIEEMRASLWQGSTGKASRRVRASNARDWFLGWFKKSRRSN